MTPLLWLLFAIAGVSFAWAAAGIAYECGRRDGLRAALARMGER